MDMIMLQIRRPRPRPVEGTKMLASDEPGLVGRSLNSSPGFFYFMTFTLFISKAF